MADATILGRHFDERLIALEAQLRLTCLRRTAMSLSARASVLFVTNLKVPVIHILFQLGVDPVGKEIWKARI